MELLEKITLYDLLGYTLPGGIVLYMIGRHDMYNELSVFGTICYISFSFLIGILISEISAFWAERLKKNKLYSLSDAGINQSVAIKALKNAKIVEKRNLTEEEITKHYVNMYSDIQTDKNYGRIHNYASAALLYKNMATVSLIGIGYYGLMGECIITTVSFVALLLFVYRWYRFEKKRIMYTINWYVKKYVTDIEK